MHPFFQYVIVGALAGTSLANAADLSVDVAGLKNAKGKVLVGVYQRAEDFLKLPMRMAAVDVQAGKVRLVIGGLPAGDYALSVFQDENSNGKLDTNPVGMPIEPYDQTLGPRLTFRHDLIYCILTPLQTSAS